MEKTLRLKRHLKAQKLDDARVFLMGGPEPVLLRGRAYALVLPLLDGRRSIREILDELAGHGSRLELLYALVQLEQRGYAGPALACGLGEGAAAFWEAHGLSADLVWERLLSGPVRVEGLGGVDHERAKVEAALAEAGVCIENDASLWILVVNDYLNPAIEAFQQRARAQKKPWILVKPSGKSGFFGPLFGPSKGPCWTCLAERLRLNTPAETYLERRALSREKSEAVLPLQTQLAAGQAAMAIARWMVDPSTFPLDQLFVVDAWGMSVQTHPVVRYPQCPSCGDPELLKKRGLAPLVLESRPKCFRADGAHRITSPEQAIQKLSRQISPITGIVAGVGPIPERDHPLRPVYGSSYRICPSHEAPSFEDFHRIAMGKGRTPAQARASAIGEAIERHSLMFRGDEPLKRASFEELGDAALHPNEIQLFSDSQYRRREELNALAQDEPKRIPLPFDPKVPIDWAPVWSLTHSRLRWAPASYCFANLNTPPSERFCTMNANGHAAGHCIEEAILQAFCELVERDSAGIWWYNRLKRPGVDLASFDIAYFDEISRHYRSMGFRIWVLDITMDMGIPAFVALAHSEREGRFCIGFGCHLDAGLGVLRALTELNQLFDPVDQGRVPWDVSGLVDLGFLEPSSGMAARRRGDFDIRPHDDLRDDILECISRAQNLGLETLVLDQSRPDTDLCTVKVMVPGLRQIWPRFGPGRLYDVPVALGLREKPIQEAELNPVPLYL